MKCVLWVSANERMIKMKKAIVILLTAVLAMAMLTSCSAGRAPKDSGAIFNFNTSSGGAMPAPSAPSEFPAPELMSKVNYDSAYGETYAYMTEAKSGGIPITAPVKDGGLAEKIIYSVNADVETIKFDDTIDQVYEIIALNGGFVESSYVGGMNYMQKYQGYQPYRTADFTLRIPVERLNAVTASLDTLGSVTALRSNAENITAQFFDTDSRLNSYKIQEERLLDMLSKTDNVPDMISIEQRLADVRYDIESLTTTLRNWQNNVDYSTLTLSIYEVQEYTEITPIYRTYWQQIGDGLAATIRSVGRFFTNLFKWIVINLPVLIILAVIAAILIIIVRRWLRRRRNRLAGYYDNYSGNNNINNNNGNDENKDGDGKNDIDNE